MKFSRSIFDSARRARLAKDSNEVRESGLPFFFTQALVQKLEKLTPDKEAIVRQELGMPMEGVTDDRLWYSWAEEACWRLCFGHTEHGAAQFLASKLTNPKIKRATP